MSNSQSSGAGETLDAFQVLVDSINQVTHTGDTSDTTLKTLTVLAGILGVNGSIRFRMAGQATGNNGEKYVRLNFGGIVVFSATIPAGVATKQWHICGAIHNVSAENNQSSSYRAYADNTIVDSVVDVSTGVNTALDKDIVLTGWLTNGADSISIRDFTIEVRPAA